MRQSGLHIKFKTFDYTNKFKSFNFNISQVQGAVHLIIQPIYVNNGTERQTKFYKGGGCHAPARPYAPVSKPGLLDEGRVPRGVQGRAGA